MIQHEYIPSPNWKYYIEDQLRKAEVFGATHVVVVHSLDDPDELGTEFYYATEGTATDPSIVEKRCEAGGGMVMAVLEVSHST